MDTDNNENIDETSPEFEPLNSVLDNEDSNDESISGMSDLVSVGSPVQLVSTENHETNSNGFESDKNSIEKSLKSPLDKNGILNHKNDNPNIEPNDKTSDNTEKPKSNDLKFKNKVQSSRERRHSDSREKSSTHRSKDRNSSRHRSSSREKSNTHISKDSNSTSHRSSSQEKNDHKKYNSRRSKDRTNSSSSSHDKHRDSNDKDKKQRRSKKSHHSDRDRTPKRDRKDSRSDKKEKSSSLCKEPKSLNGNRSDDESNGGGSSKQKSSIHKYKSSTSDKSKSSSSNHKSSRKDNGSKDVVDKLKDKTSKSSDSSSYKNGQTDIKKRKLSLEEPNNSNVEEKKLKWNELRSTFMTNDEQDAANILLSMREIPFESSQNEIITENIIFIENSSTNENLKLSMNTTENKLEVQENNLKSNENINEKEKLNLKTNDSEVLKSIDFINSNCKDVSKNNPSFKKACLEIIKSNSSYKNANSLHSSSIENVKIDLLPNKKVESVEGLKLETNSTENIEMNLDPIKQVESVEDVKFQINSIENTKLDLKPCNEQVELKDVKVKTSFTHHVEKKFSNKQIELVNDVNLQLLNSIENVTIDLKQNKQVELAKDIKLQSSSIEDNEMYSKFSNVEDIKLQTRSNVDSEQNKQFGSIKNVKLHHIRSTENIKIDSEPIKQVELGEEIKLKSNSIKNVKIELDKQVEQVNKEKEVKPLNVKINNSGVNYMTSECISNNILKVPKLKLKLSSTIMRQEKRKKHHKSNDTKYKKIKSSKSNIFDDVPVIDTVKTALTCKQNDQKYKCDVDIEIKESVNSPCNHISQHKKCEIRNTQLLISNDSMYTFKGFSHEEAVPCKNYKLLKDFIKNVQSKITNAIDDVEMKDYACTDEISRDVEDKPKDKSNCSIINCGKSQSLVFLSENNHNLTKDDGFNDTTYSDEMNLDVENEFKSSVCTDENNYPITDSNGFKSLASLGKNRHIIIDDIVPNNLSCVKKNEHQTVDDDNHKSSACTNKKNHIAIIEKNTDTNVPTTIINDDEFKGFSSTDIKEDQQLFKKRKLVYAQLMKLKKIAKGFKGFSEKEAQISIGYTFLKQQLELAKQQNNVNDLSKNVASGKNGIQNGRKLNDVMAIICDQNRDDDDVTTRSNPTNIFTNSNDNNTAPDQTNDQPNNDNNTTPSQTINQSNNENITSPNQTNSQPNNDDKSYSPAIINNNHDISTSNNWVVQQEMKYKLLPVKVKLERMLEYNCNSEKFFIKCLNTFN